MYLGAIQMNLPLNSGLYHYTILLPQMKNAFRGNLDFDSASVVLMAQIQFSDDSP